MQNDDTSPTIFINRYHIEKELSHNAGRKTFLALDLQSQDLVIVKILQFDNLFRWDDLKLFEREAQTLQNIDHPAIPKYLDYFEVEEHGIHGFALVQTYIDATSLETNFKSGRRFSEAELIELATKLLDILTYLHSQIPPVIHRDIKPSNILIANRSAHSVGDIYLVDFGSVQTVASKDNGTITIVGTYGYIPLEQFSGKTTVASDLYSLGMTLIYLIMGVHPAGLNQVEGKVQFSNKELSRQFTEWLEKMTYPYPEKRFESAESAKNALVGKSNLTSKDGSSGNYLHLRPANSKVTINRDINKLEIVYPESLILANPPVANCFLVLFLFISIVVFVDFLLGYVGIIYGFILFVVLNNLLIKLLAFVYNNIFLKTIRHMKITIYTDNYFLGYTQKMLRLRPNEIYFNAKEIKSLYYSPGYIFNEYKDETGTIKTDSIVRIPTKLSFCTDSREYFIGEKRLSKAELWWLGQEISDCLGLELQVIYATPKLPPKT